MPNEMANVARQILEQRGEQPTNVNLSAIMDALLVNPDLFDNVQGALRNRGQTSEQDVQTPSPSVLRDPFDQALETAVNGGGEQQQAQPSAPPVDINAGNQPAPSQDLQQTPVTSEQLPSLAGIGAQPPIPQAKPDLLPPGFDVSAQDQARGEASEGGGDGIRDALIAALAGAGAFAGGRALLKGPGQAAPTPSPTGVRGSATGPKATPAPTPAAVPVARPAVGPIDAGKTKAQVAKQNAPKAKKAAPKPKRGQSAKPKPKTLSQSVGETVDVQDAKVARTRSRATGPRDVTHAGRPAVNVEVDGTRYIVDDQGRVATEAGPENVFDVRDKTVLQRIKQVLTESGSKFAKLMKIL